MNQEVQILKMMMSKMTPQQAVMNMLGNNNNPIMGNLKNMAEKGDVEGLKSFAQNMFKEQGRDFDKEFNEFMSNFK